MSLELLLEAERRGILPADKVPLLAEARRRGLIPGGGPQALPSGAGNAAPDSGTLAEIGRQAGLTGRHVTEGAASLLGVLTNPMAAGLAELTGDQFEPLDQLAGRTLDSVGVPRPQGGLEELVGAASRGLVQTGLTAGAGSALAASNAPSGAAALVGRQLTAQPVLQAAGAITGGGAADAVRQSGGGQGAQLAAGLAGALAPTVGPQLLGATVRGTLRGGDAGRQQLQAAIDDFARAGDTPTLGQGATGGGGRLAEAVIRNTPGGSGRVAARLEQQQANVGRTVDELAGRLSGATGAERGGRAIIRGITGPSGFMARFRETSTRLYDEMAKLLPPGTSLPAASTQRVLQQLTTPIAGAESTSAQLLNSRVAAIAKAFSDDLAASNGVIPYEAMKRLRTQIGEFIGDSALSPDTPTRQLRSLYGAMTDDMTQAAMATGNPQVIRAAGRANNYYRAGMQRVEEIERVVDRAGGPEAVYRAMFTNSREGGTTLRRVMQSLGGESQRDLAAVTLRRMGRANPSAQDDVGEQFSSETFLTNWNRMAPEAKRALFDRFGTRFRSDLDQIASATSRARDAAGILSNPSGTAPLAAQVTAYGALSTAIMSGSPEAATAIGGALGASNLAARAFTSPTVVRWLAKQTQAPVSAIPASMQELAKLAESDEDARAVLEAINAAGSAQASQSPQPRR